MGLSVFNAQSALAGVRPDQPCQKGVVQARDGENRDPLVAGEKTPAKPSQTFSRDPAKTGLAEGAFAALAGRNGTSAPFSPVKSAIKHNGH